MKSHLWSDQIRALAAIAAIGIALPSMASAEDPPAADAMKKPMKHHTKKMKKPTAEKPMTDKKM
jgi:hypothetical protein